MKKLVAAFKKYSIVALVALFPALAFAAEPAVPTTDDPLSLLTALVKALGEKNWLLVVPLALIGAIYAIRGLFGDKWAWLKTDRGGATLALISAVLSALVAVAMTPGPHTVSSVLTAVLAILAGQQALWSWLRKILAPTGGEAAAGVAQVAGSTGQQAQTAAAASPEAAAKSIITDLK